jgi:hypothetical protein
MKKIGPVIALVVLLSIASALPDEHYHQIDGRGDDAVELPNLRDGLLMVAAVHQGTSNFVLQLYDASGARSGLLVNAIGDYEGGRLAQVEAGTHTLEVKASGPWRIRYQQPSATAAGTPPPLEHRATGDLPLGPIHLSAGLLRASFTHSGRGNFVVFLYQADGRRAGLLVNAIGDYSGTIAQQIRAAGSYYLDVMAGGEWTIKIP